MRKRLLESIPQPPDLGKRFRHTVPGGASAILVDVNQARARPHLGQVVHGD